MANEADLATAVADAVHPLGVMQRITDRTLGLIESAQGVMIGVADPSGVTYVTGSGNQTLLIGTRVELGSSLTGVAVRTGEVQRSADTELDDRGIGGAVLGEVGDGFGVPHRQRQRAER